MEVTNASESVGHDAINSASSRVQMSGITVLNDDSEEARIFLEEQGGEIHPIFGRDDQYLQQRFVAPTQSAFR